MPAGCPAEPKVPATERVRQRTSCVIPWPCVPPCGSGPVSLTVPLVLRRRPRAKCDDRLRNLNRYPPVGLGRPLKPCSSAGPQSTGRCPATDLGRREPLAPNPQASLGHSGADGRSWRTGSPLGSCRPAVRLRQAAAMGGPRRHSIRRRISANSILGTATSASWKTRYRPWRTIRAPIFTSFSRSVVSDHCATSCGRTRSAGSWRGCRQGRGAGAARRCGGRSGRTAASSAAHTCPL